LAVGLGKGLEAWDELLLPVLGEREAVVAEREPGGAVEPSNFDKASLARFMRLA
jgi:hypothetical protein